MTDTSLAAVLDDLSEELVAGTDLKAVYTITGTEADDGSLRPIPPSFDSLPVGILWFQGETVDAGNAEATVDSITLLIFQRGTNGGYGYSTLVPYTDAIRILMRKDIAQHERATRRLYRGAGQIYPQTIDNGQPYLVLPINIEITRYHYSDDYSDT
ncbi:MAG TPA: hypothetical protein VFJ93_07640 [Gaiellaceae bacterium]|nr:hypothetical protein [Gaiellaceae bacterium]